MKTRKAISNTNANVNNLKLRLSSETPLRALAGKAEMASAIAALAKTRRSEDVPTKPKKRMQLSGIELAMANIRKAIDANPFDGCEAKFEKPDRFSSAHEVLHVFRIEDINLRNKEKQERKANPASKLTPLMPVRSFVFYASDRNPAKLGSVAIYGEDVYLQCGLIKKSGTLFGMEVVKAEVKIGRRPFVDVTLRA